MIEPGQLWVSGGRVVRIIGMERSNIVVRDTYGWRRLLSERELRDGFRQVVARRAEGVRGVMGRRALADVDPS